jgi:energy-coupling factor transporter transmembrane protein EcfT
MYQGLFTEGCQCAGYALEGGLLVLLLARGYAKRLPALVLFVATLLGVDAGVRPWTLHHYGFSHQYFVSYWVTELLLVFGAFLLICAFFRRACIRHPEVWTFVRPILALVLLLVLVISCSAFTQHYNQLFSRYIYEFGENLWFGCVVLNTVLYLMLQRLHDTDGQLHLLVCGLGIQYAGPAANAALAVLTGNQGGPRALLEYLSPVCALGMLALWFYAVIREPRAVRRGLRSTSQRIPVTV